LPMVDPRRWAALLLLLGLCPAALAVRPLLPPPVRSGLCPGPPQSARRGMGHPTPLPVSPKRQALIPLTTAHCKPVFASISDPEA